ncbi:glycosyltransferase family protein [Nocardioides sp.]|uniref:glycosyltransferase family protein n=1 Tax=Nocardioides sp. TaxID=35761 RepID=UPI002CB41A44|nr:glycosyltransferase [Nocardioides sp.]HXH77835.1 glycosyltransferase [Nocardioides sp.]
MTTGTSLSEAVGGHDGEHLSTVDRRRAAYRQLIDGELATGDGERVLFFVHSVDLRHATPDLVAAAGLGLALSDRGYGVRLVPRHRWHLGGSAEIWIATTPDADPSQAPVDAWRVAWAHSETEAWAELDHLMAFDQMLVGSEVARSILVPTAARRVDVLRNAADVELFAPRDEPAPPRDGVVSLGVNVERGRAIQPLINDLRLTVPLTVYAEPLRSMRSGLLGRLEEPIPWLRAPEVLTRSELTVIELPGTAMGDATLSPHFFESLACGSLPVVNSRLGATECGLDVPTYRSSDELGQRITSLLADPETIRARVEELRERVLLDHTWDLRAAEFEETVATARSDQTSAPPHRALHYFPDYNRANPYQGMLFAGLTAVDAYPVAVTDVIEHLENRSVASVPGTLNIHWTTPIMQYATGPFRAAIELDRFSAALHKFRTAGGRLVWTLHNVLPHETRHVWAETQLAQLIADRADAIHALSEITARQASEVLRLDPRRVVVIEHSSYLGRYPHWISRDAARKQLGLGPDDKVLVALGGIRPYKGLGRLLDVFHELAEDDPSLRLLVAGKPAQTQETAGLQRRCEQSSRVISEFSYVPDDQLQVWFGAADLAVLPYSRILNSGVFWLAQSFGLPIVGPRTGALLDLADEPHVRLFNPRDDRSLKQTLRSTIVDLVNDPDRLAAAREASLRAARARPPHRMAEDFAEFIEPLLTGQDRSRRRVAG